MIGWTARTGNFHMPESRKTRDPDRLARASSTNDRHCPDGGRIFLGSISFRLSFRTKERQHASLPTINSSPKSRLSSRLAHFTRYKPKYPSRVNHRRKVQGRTRRVERPAEPDLVPRIRLRSSQMKRKELAG